MLALTDRQRAILVWLQAYVATKGYPPTIREISTAFGIRSTNGVVDHLSRLEAKGWIERDPFATRGIRLLTTSSTSKEA